LAADDPTIPWQFAGKFPAFWCYTSRACSHRVSTTRPGQRLSTGRLPQEFAMRYRFGDWTLDTQLYTLHRAGCSRQLRPKVFQVLTYLVAHGDRVVSRQELCEQVWPDQYISEAALESAIRAARQALGDSGRTQQYIQTLHGHGYRFIAPVHCLPAAAAPAETAA